MYHPQQRSHNSNMYHPYIVHTCINIITHAYNSGGDGVYPRSPLVKSGDLCRGLRPVEAAEEPPGEGVGEV